MQVASEASRNFFWRILSLSNKILPAEYEKYIRNKYFCQNLGGGQLTHSCMYPLLFVLNRYSIQNIFKTQCSENDLLHF